MRMNPAALVGVHVCPVDRVKPGGDNNLRPGGHPMTDFRLPETRYALSRDISIAYQAMGVVTDLVAGAGLKFAERGSFELKGLPSRWDLFAASG
jgi:hypothetical protein